MKKYEYKELGYEEILTDFIGELNRQGVEGWKIAISPNPEAKALLLMREIPEKAEDHSFIWKLGRLYTAVELVLLNNQNKLSGELVDPDFTELAFDYEVLTGWTVDKES